MFHNGSSLKHVKTTILPSFFMRKPCLTTICHHFFHGFQPSVVSLPRFFHRRRSATASASWPGRTCAARWMRPSGELSSRNSVVVSDHFFEQFHCEKQKHIDGYIGMDQYLLIPFLVGWTSIYQLFWCSPGVQGFDTLPYIRIYIYIYIHIWL